MLNRIPKKSNLYHINQVQYSQTKKKKKRIIEAKITSMLLGVGSASNKYFEWILLSKAVTYMTSRSKSHQLTTSKKKKSEITPRAIKRN